MPRCSGIKRDQGKCTVIVGPSERYCYWHHPANQEQRTRNASKAGRAKAGKRVAWIWDEVSSLIEKVERGELDPPRANVMIRAFHVLIAQRRLELDEEERLSILPLIEQLEAQREADR
jgi:hypothetical protein